MGKETESNPRPISGVSLPVTISGEDIHGQRFIESSTAFLVRRKGAVLDTIHELAAEASLEITNMTTNRNVAARVKTLGPRLGPRQRILVEVEDMENFGLEQYGSDRRKPDIPEGVSEADVTETALASRPAERAADPYPEDREQQPLPAAPSPYTPPESSRLNLPATDRLAQLLDELVRSALEPHLRPAVDRITGEVQQQAEQITRSVLLDMQEMVETSIVTSISRLRAQAAEVVSSQNQALEATVEASIHGTEHAIGSRQNEAVSFLLDRARQVEDEVAGRLARQAGESADRFSVELEARQKDALEAYTAALGKRLEAVENDLVNRTSGLLADLQRQLAEAAATVRENFVQQTGSKLNEIQDQLVQQTRRMATEAAQQNLGQMRSRLVRLVKEMGEALEKEDFGNP